MKLAFFLIACIASCLVLTHCGGGGGSGSSEATIRPKTLDGVVIRLDNAVSFEFVRSSSSAAALNDGEEETGTFYYTSSVGLVNLRNYDNIAGSQSNLWWPQSVASAKYTYRAINASSGVLTLTGIGSIQDTYFSFDWGTGRVLNDSAIIPFLRGSYYDTTTSFDYDETNTVRMDLTFASNGSTVSTNMVTFSLPESTMVNTFDTVRISSVLSLATGGDVPEDYNPSTSYSRESKIAPASLSDRLLKATNGIPDATKDFTIQFVADKVGTSSTSQEIGRGLLKVKDSTGTFVSVTIALDYTWKRTSGTDDGELVLSNIPDDASLPFDVSLNGTYTLNFSGSQTGTYVGLADGDTASAADVTGTFLLLNAGD